MTFREFHFEDRNIMYGYRGLGSILFYAFASFLTWNALFWLVLTSLQRLQELKPRVSTQIVYTRVVTFFIIILAVIVDIVNYALHSSPMVCVPL